MPRTASCMASAAPAISSLSPIKCSVMWKLSWGTNLPPQDIPFTSFCILASSALKERGRSIAMKRRIIHILRMFFSLMITYFMY